MKPGNIWKNTEKPSSSIPSWKHFSIFWGYDKIELGHTSFLALSINFFDKRTASQRRQFSGMPEVPHGKSNFLLKPLQYQVSLAPQLQKVRVDSTPSMV